MIICDLFAAGGFELATSTAHNRKRLIDSIVSVIEEYNLDGVDIDWEFPSWGHNFSRRFERDNFVYLLKVRNAKVNSSHSDYCCKLKILD